MYGNHRKSSYSDQICEEATEWFIRFCENEVGPAACAEFDSWLRASPVHVRAYLDISALWDAAGSMNRTRDVRIDELVQRARAADNIVALEAPSEVRKQDRPVRNISRHGLAVAASLLLVSLITGLLAWWYMGRYPSYATRVGEQRTVRLDDGSMVELNSQTRIKIRFTQAKRGVELVEGQALFRVAKNPARPFIVSTGVTTVRAVGTEFDVYRKLTGTVVTVVEGRVAVGPPAKAPAAAGAQEEHPQPLLVSTGEQVTVTPRVTPAPKKTNTALATAWTQGKLVFDSTPVSEVIQEFNRYNVHALSVTDPNILTLHISGTFSTTDSAQLVRFLADRFNLVARDTEEGVRLAPE